MKTPRPTGLMRSRELHSLSSPLAALLVIVFTLTIHLNASFAAGSDSSLCLWAGKFASTDINGQTQATPNTHCSLCSLSDDPNVALRFATEKFPLSSQSELIEIADYNLGYLIQIGAQQIRAPPLS